MTRTVDLESEAVSLRGAVGGGDFERAARSAERYCQALRALAHDAPQPETARLVSEARELLEWARRNLCAARAHLRYRLRHAQRLARYRLVAQDSTHTWAIHG